MLNHFIPLCLLTAGVLCACSGDSSTDADWNGNADRTGTSSPPDPFGSDDDSDESSDTPPDTVAPIDTGVPEPDEEEETEAESHSTDDAICAEAYSLCGDLIIPSDITGTTRSLAIVLYSSIPPAGPPEGIVEEVSNPELSPGGRYPVRVLPALFNGDYYVWVNLYMEGGGEWAPVDGVDYLGYTAEPVNFDGTAISFADISLSLAGGW